LTFSKKARLLHFWITRSSLLNKSDSLRFEIEAFSAFRSVAEDTAIQNGTKIINNATDAIVGM
jgi:hypothetical protein